MGVLGALLLVGRPRLAMASVGRSPRCWARVWSLVDGEHCLAPGESLLQRTDLVDGLGRWRLGLDCWRWIIPRAGSASASATASPSSTTTPSSGRLLLLLSGSGWEARLWAEARGVPRDEAVSADDRLGAWFGVKHAVWDCVEAGHAPPVLDAGD